MPTPQAKPPMQRFLEGLSKTLVVIGGLSFFVGGVVIYAAGKADRFLAEVIGIGITFLCLVLAVIAKYKAEDLEWEAENQDLIDAAKAAQSQAKPK